MKSLKILSVVLICILPFKFAIGQTEKPVIIETFNNYFIKIKEKKFNNALDFIYPEFYKYKNKGSFLDEINFSELETANLYNLDSYVIDSVEGISRFYKNKYSKIFVSIHTTYNLDFINNGNKNIDYTESAIDNIISGIRNNTNCYNIEYNKENSKITFYIRKEYFAILNPKIGNWKLLENDIEHKDILRKILPKDLTEK